MTLKRCGRLEEKRSPPWGCRGKRGADEADAAVHHLEYGSSLHASKYTLPSSGALSTAGSE
eukprot:9500506-Pyramimonas_sp.AAC.2